jgi:glycosyltransferase involved in cell wall biosynthesis
MPSYDPELKHHNMFIDMIKSIDTHSKGQDYELIIRKNSGSYTDAFNDAMLSTRGDYIISVQDDMIIKDSQWLEKLTDSECFVTTEMNKYPNGDDCPYWAIFGMPRKIFEKVGLLDKIYRDGIYYEDDDYIRRMNVLGIKYKVSPINYIHLGGVITDSYLEKKKEMGKHNEIIFKKKWNIN